VWMPLYHPTNRSRVAAGEFFAMNVHGSIDTGTIGEDHCDRTMFADRRLTRRYRPHVAEEVEVGIGRDLLERDDGLLSLG